VGIFSETESPAVKLLGEQGMTREDAVNFIVHGIAKGGGDNAA
jgi:ATP-dependent Clp protease ATP-binding subunit ClpA